MTEKNIGRRYLWHRKKKNYLQFKLQWAEVVVYGAESHTIPHGGFHHTNSQMLTQKL